MTRTNKDYLFGLSTGIMITVVWHLTQMPWQAAMGLSYVALFLSWRPLPKAPHTPPTPL